ncbi:LytR C-terminal domain-containing protein [Actinoplanes couchii]|nr:LytR C-terminal domain-containing protein [Actinoplanes couchii]MDR6317584.1 hypothetical protein [Actinoplanes couchii]
MRLTRLRAQLVVGLLVVSAAVVVVVAVTRDSQADASAGRGCPPGAVLVNTDLPQDAADVTLRVLNGTGTAGLADRVSTEFGERGFRMQAPGKSTISYDQVAVVRYGPRTVGAAQWIRAHFLGAAEPRYSPERNTDVIDVVVGARYQQLATFTEVNQSMAQLSEPDLPPGACAA